MLMDDVYLLTARHFPYELRRSRKFFSSIFGVREVTIWPQLLMLHILSQVVFPFFHSLGPLWWLLSVFSEISMMGEGSPCECLVSRIQKLFITIFDENGVALPIDSLEDRGRSHIT